ncbi:type 1 fimbrial protein [Entomohabitans teleogrylli]|uniref:type 1 fimbrial protein n=1 Tax=Entomohabitans teleogrylli TaxID=1384589 RepID=UPI00073D4A87|nr:type 1 fimbrial protein [Entomohabitans teleogrylli]
MKIKSGNLCIFIILIFNIMSAQAASGGVIHFYGRVVESGCDITQNGQHLNMTCDDKGKPVVYQASVTNLSPLTSRDYRIERISRQNIQGRPNLAIINVEYK